MLPSQQPASFTPIPSSLSHYHSPLSPSSYSAFLGLIRQIHSFSWAIHPCFSSGISQFEKCFKLHTFFNSVLHSISQGKRTQHGALGDCSCSSLQSQPSTFYWIINKRIMASNIIFLGVNVAILLISKRNISLRVWVWPTGKACPCQCPSCWRL